MTSNDILLGVNIDHVATLRQARHTRYPDPIEAMFAAEAGGADGITVHLREDRRHINERDVSLIQSMCQTRLNLEMAVTDEMIRYAEIIQPTYVCFVPEKREELTTEGGLDVIAHRQRLHDAIVRLTSQGIKVSLFIDPSLPQIDAAREIGAPYIELHTGEYADAMQESVRDKEYARILQAATHAHELGLMVNAGHGLNYQNVQAIAAIKVIHELNIGHAIVARALFSGFKQAVFEMKQLMRDARNTIRGYA